MNDYQFSPSPSSTVLPKSSSFSFLAPVGRYAATFALTKNLAVAPPVRPTYCVVSKEAFISS
ncbi:hypothetical protein L873DRAFT_1816503 [Choiromyces venosus 120613-1]|uniref:Uncharacterized protein n=1 Tax=Choiromyces venosus 120613-1 TaxID=1336337 RepID=A0A3N4J9G8_9PEZI|nr:hypothetical protein L873DRAFT_1816503 [Choiromyces venosus 120613-1]